MVLGAASLGGAVSLGAEKTETIRRQCTVVADEESVAYSVSQLSSQRLARRRATVCHFIHI